MLGKKYKYDYPENRETAKNLRHGDAADISRLSGFTLGYVHEVLKGKRNNELIIEITKKIIKNREALYQAIQTAN